MSYDVRIEQQASIPLAVVRRRAALSDLATIVPACCGLVWNALRAKGLRGGRHVAIYWDDQINLEVGVELDAPLGDAGEVVASQTPAGMTAVTTHLGPYNRLHLAHTAIRDWCAQHGRNPAGPNWEIYDHWRDEWNRDPSQIRTDVYYLLSADVS